MSAMIIKFYGIITEIACKSTQFLNGKFFHAKAHNSKMKLTATHELQVKYLWNFGIL